MKYLGYLRDWLVGAAVTAIAFGLIALIVSAMARPVAMGGDGAKVVAGLPACAPFFAWVHLAFRGWVGQPFFGSSDTDLAAFSPDGKLVAGGCGSAVLLWDLESGKLLTSLSGHSEGVQAVAFSPDGATLASAASGDIRLWAVAP